MPKFRDPIAALEEFYEIVKRLTEVQTWMDDETVLIQFSDIKYDASVLIEAYEEEA